MKKSLYGADIFGNTLVLGKRGVILDDFIVSPFSILDTASGFWQRRKKAWVSYGIKSELGRDSAVFNMSSWVQKTKGTRTSVSAPDSDTSIFDPVICELMCSWFSPERGQIVDPFAGGSVRGIVASLLGFKYWGCDDSDR